MDRSSIKVGAVLINTQDPESLAGFYREAFNLTEPRRDGDDHLGFALANTYLGFDRVAEAPTGARVSVWFHVEDIAGMAARLVELGGEEVMPPAALPNGEWIAEVHDPEGNRIGLIATKGPGVAA